MKLTLKPYKQEVTIDAFSIVYIYAKRHILPGGWFDKTPEPSGFHVFVYGEGPGYYVYQDDDPHGFYDNEHGRYRKVEYDEKELKLGELSKTIRDLAENEVLDFTVMGIVEHTHKPDSFRKDRISQTSLTVDFDDSYIPKAFEAALEYAKAEGKDELAKALGKYMELDPDQIF